VNQIVTLLKVHMDVNREGVRCTLIGGVKQGQAFDAMKMKTLKEYVGGCDSRRDLT
jgi:hypothetical protein